MTNDKHIESLSESEKMQAKTKEKIKELEKNDAETVRQLSGEINNLTTTLTRFLTRFNDLATKCKQMGGGVRASRVKCDALSDSRKYQRNFKLATSKEVNKFKEKELMPLSKAIEQASYLQNILTGSDLENGLIQGQLLSMCSIAEEIKVSAEHDINTWEAAIEKSNKNKKNK